MARVKQESFRTLPYTQFQAPTQLAVFQPWRIGSGTSLELLGNISPPSWP